MNKIKQYLEQIKDDNNNVYKNLSTITESNEFENIENILSQLKESVEHKEYVLSNNDLKLLNNFTTIIHDQNNYLGYYIQGKYIQLYVANKESHSELFQYKVTDIYNIFSKEKNQINISTKIEKLDVYFHLESKHINNAILKLTNIISNLKTDVNK